MNRSTTLIVLTLSAVLAGCMETKGGVPVTRTSERANAAADQTLYQPVDYENQSVRGPTLIVLPGQVKSHNATFAQRVTPNNVADYGELELGRANFRVLERADLGPMLNEITLAVNMGDPQALKRFRRGKFKSTQWFVKFDILKAEPVATATESFDSGVVGSMLGGLTGNYYVGRTAGSVRTAEESGVWIVGLRYKLVDARTSEQVATGYHEAKMEVGKKAAGFLGYSQGQKGGVTLDSMTQRLVQMAVQDIDKMKGSASTSRSGRRSAYSAERTRIKNLQQAPRM